jgi:hypothetical protein
LNSKKRAGAGAGAAGTRKSKKNALSLPPRKSSHSSPVLRFLDITKYSWGGARWGKVFYIEINFYNLYLKY